VVMAKGGKNQENQGSLFRDENFKDKKKNLQRAKHVSGMVSKDRTSKTVRETTERRGKERRRKKRGGTEWKISAMGLSINVKGGGGEVKKNRGKGQGGKKTGNRPIGGICLRGKEKQHSLEEREENLEEFCGNVGSKNEKHLTKEGKGGKG